MKTAVFLGYALFYFRAKSLPKSTITYREKRHNLTADTNTNQQ